MNSKKQLFAFLLLLSGIFLSAQAPINFERYYDYGFAEAGNAVDQTSDGGYIIFGRQGISIGVSKILLIKVDSIGNEQWHKLIGSNNTDNYAYSGQQTSDGGYIMTGFTGIAGQGLNVYLVKTDSNGDTLWTRNYGGTGYDQGWSVEQTTDGGYIIAGETADMIDTTDKAYLIKTDSVGDTLWTRKYIANNAVGGATAYSVQQTPDSGYIACGQSGSLAGNIYLVKMNANGDSLWTKCIKRSQISESANAVSYTSDGGYIISGFAWNGSDDDFLWLKTDSNGDTLWTHSYGGISGDYLNSVQSTTDGGYILAGSTSSSGNGDMVLIKLNTAGDTIWSKLFTNSLTSEGTGWSDGAVQQTLDGGFVIVGMTDLGTASAYLIKTDSVGFAITGMPSLLSSELNFSVFPNPFSETATLRITDAIKILPDLSYEIIDLVGRCIKKVSIENGGSEIQIINNNFPAGVYFLQLQSESKTIGSLKIIVQ